MTCYDVVSASSHLWVGTKAWRDHVEAAHRDAVPVWPAPDRSPVAGSSCADPTKRVEEMERDGVDAEVLFPAAIGSRALSGLEPEAQMAAVRGYNDWLSEIYTAAAPDRLLGVALLPATRVQDAVDEMLRVMSMPGIRAVLLQQWPNGSGVPTPSDDRFWEQAALSSTPLCAWRTFGGGATAAPRPPSVPAPMPLALSLVSGQCTTQTQLITEGVLDRFPTLQILFAGLGVGWVPNQVEQADDMFRRHRYWGGFAEQHTQGNYFPSHCKWTFTYDPFGIRVRNLVGIENILWSSDFPREETEWPNSRQSLKEQLADVPDDEAWMITAGNAVRFFHLDSSLD
jgi:predicted TIM-barrel fold metal-dependent hydrolase